MKRFATVQFVLVMSAVSSVGFANDICEKLLISASESRPILTLKGVREKRQMQEAESRSQRIAKILSQFPSRDMRIKPIFEQAVRIAEDEAPLSANKGEAIQNLLRENERHLSINQVFELGEAIADYVLPTWLRKPGTFIEQDRDLNQVITEVKKMTQAKFLLSVSLGRQNSSYNARNLEYSNARARFNQHILNLAVSARSDISSYPNILDFVLRDTLKKFDNITNDRSLFPSELSLRVSILRALENSRSVTEPMAMAIRNILGEAYRSSRVDDQKQITQQVVSLLEHTIVTVPVASVDTLRKVAQAVRSYEHFLENKNEYAGTSIEKMNNKIRQALQKIDERIEDLEGRGGVLKDSESISTAVVVVEAAQLVHKQEISDSELSALRDLVRNVDVEHFVDELIPQIQSAAKREMAILEFVNSKETLTEDEFYTLYELDGLTKEIKLLMDQKAKINMPEHNENPKPASAKQSRAYNSRPH